MIKMLFDVDTGVDDSIALLYALKHPQVRVVGVSTGCGNTDAAQAAENTIRIIALANPDYLVPVAIGASQPLKGKWGGPEPQIHGKNGIGDVILPASTQKPLEEKAEDFIIRMAKEHAGELVLVCLGRMTNLALALQKEPRLPAMIKHIVMMGGTIHAPGNVSPVVEANIYGDPEAADQVFTAGFELTMVGLDVTLKTRLSLQQISICEKYVAPENTAIIDYMKTALQLYANFNRQQNYCLDHFPVHDPLAALVAVEPSLVRTRRVKARVECAGTYCRGMVVADLREHPFDAEYINICEEVDGVRAVETLLAVFCRA